MQVFVKQKLVKGLSKKKCEVHPNYFKFTTKFKSAKI